MTENRQDILYIKAKRDTASLKYVMSYENIKFMGEEGTEIKMQRGSFERGNSSCIIAGSYYEREYFDIARTPSNTITVLNFKHKKTNKQFRILSSDFTEQFMGSDVRTDGKWVSLRNYEPIDNPLKEDTSDDWSNTRRKTVNFSNTYLKEQIRSRYAFFDRPKNGLSNVIIDSFFPRLLYKHSMNIHSLNTLEKPKLPKTAVAISPLIADILNVKQVPLEQLCRVLGYTVKDIKNVLNRVKAKNYQFVFVGAGGTGINTAHWLTKLCEMTSTINLFKRASVYEKDDLEISNILRFPINPNSFISTGSTKKLHLIKPYLDKLSKVKPYTSFSYLPEKSPNGTHYYDREFYKYNGGLLDERHTVLYGAPGLESRDLLSKYGNFISGTHANTSCHLWLNPKQDTEFQTETYGMIQLGGFFVNQLKMTIALMEYLGQDEVDLSSKDVELLDFEFDGTRQLPTDRQYNWQIDRNMRMLTEEQANNI